jgi:hypothetical protein
MSKIFFYVLVFLLFPYSVFAADDLDLVARSFQGDFSTIFIGLFSLFAYLAVYVILPLKVFQWILIKFLSYVSK